MQLRVGEGEHRVRPRRAADDLRGDGLAPPGVGVGRGDLAEAVIHRSQAVAVRLHAEALRRPQRALDDGVVPHRHGAEAGGHLRTKHDFRRGFEEFVGLTVRDGVRSPDIEDPLAETSVPGLAAGHQGDFDGPIGDTPAGLPDERLLQHANEGQH